MTNLSSQLNQLRASSRISRPPDSVLVTPITGLTSLPQPRLNLGVGRNQVVMDDIKVLVGGESTVRRKWWPHEKLYLLRGRLETISRLEANSPTDGRDHLPHLCVKVGAVIEDVNVRVADPGGRSSAVKLPGQLETLSTTGIILAVVVRLGTVRRGHEVNNLVVTVVSKLDGVPTVCFKKSGPAFLAHVSRGVHYAPVADDNTVLLASTCEGEEGPLHGDHHLY